VKPNVREVTYSNMKYSPGRDDIYNHLNEKENSGADLDDYDHAHFSTQREAPDDYDHAQLSTEHGTLDDYEHGNLTTELVAPDDYDHAHLSTEPNPPQEDYWHPRSKPVPEMTSQQDDDAYDTPMSVHISDNYFTLETRKYP
jgi:hypothetical protein